MPPTEPDNLIARTLIDRYGLETFMLAREVHATCALEGNTLTIGEVIEIVARSQQ